MMSSFDVDLNDDELNDEIQLLAELMVIASESSAALDPRIVDETLGVHPEAGPSFPTQRAQFSR